MARNASGIYSLPPGSSVANGDLSDASDLNTPISDIAADLNVARPIVAGGTGATSASAALVNFGLTATAAEINKLDGVTATTAELNILDGVTATTAELNALDGVTAFSTGLFTLADAAAGRTELELGTAATAATGTATGNVVALEDVGGSPGLPAVDGSQLTGLGKWDYESDPITVSANSATNFVHGLGTKSPLVVVFLVCTVANNDYSVGDEVEVGSYAPGFQRGLTVRHLNTTTLQIVIATNGLLIVHPTTRAEIAVLFDSWDMIVRARK